jgi:hypothetical protein
MDRLREKTSSAGRTPLADVRCRQGIEAGRSTERPIA